MSNIPEINVKRRRKGEPPAKRATAPQRRGSETGPRPAAGIPSLGAASRMLKGTRGKLGCGSILMIIVCVVLYLMLSSGPDTGQLPAGEPLPKPTQPVEPVQPSATRTPRPTLPLSAAGAGPTWLVMLYQDADDQVLEQDIYIDLNEVERVGSSSQVTIIAQLDRFRGGFQGSEDWSTTRRYLITQDDDLNAIGSSLLADLGEVNMADGRSLVDFVVWAIQNYPADHYALILSDHGMGWPGGWSDPAPGGTDPSVAPLAAMIGGDHIFLSELDDALQQVQEATGIEKLDLIGLDACLMSQLEVLTALQPYAHTLVASEETEPSLGWAYAAFLRQLVQDPSMTPGQLAASIVETYIDEDERIVDDQARAEFLRQGSSLGGFFSSNRVSAEQLASQLEQGITLTAVNLDTLPEFLTSFNDFVYALQDIDQQVIASARNYAQSYTSIFGRQVPPSYIDLGHFVQLVARQDGSRAVQSKADALLNALNGIVIAERHGKDKPGSTGVAIYYPNSTLYRSPYTGMQSYTQIASRFARAALWDDFLVYHYSNRSFTPEAAEPAAPPAQDDTRAPGVGAITVSPVESSARTVSLGDSVRLSAEIRGDNIGYIFLFTGLYDPTSNSIYVADTDYLESPDTEELNGVFYPAWPESAAFRMNFDWEPVLFAISDGTVSTLALFNPVAYGITAEEATYAVQGTYTFAATGEQRRAELYFKDGRLFQVFGFNGEEAAGSPAEITPAAGDTFTLLNRWLELDESGGVSQVINEDGETLTFSNHPFTWEQVYAPAGEYLVGFLVSDLDGNLNQAYTQIMVDE